MFNVLNIIPNCCKQCQNLEGMKMENKRYKCGWCVLLPTAKGTCKRQRLISNLF